MILVLWQFLLVVFPAACDVYARQLYGRTFYNDCGTHNVLVVHHVAVQSLYFDDASTLRESGSCKMSLCLRFPRQHMS